MVCPSYQLPKSATTTTRIRRCHQRPWKLPSSNVFDMCSFFIGAHQKALPSFLADFKFAEEKQNFVAPVGATVGRNKQASTGACEHCLSLADPGGRVPPPCPKDYFQIMQLSGNFKGQFYFEQMLGSGPPWGQNSAGPPHQNPGSASACNESN